MKKIIKAKRVVLALVLVFSMIAMTACGGKQGDKNASDKKTLHVAAINKGYGIEWLENMLEAFCSAKGWDYVVYPVYTDGVLTQKIEAGIEACNYDLVFSGSTMVASSDSLLDLTEVLESTIEEGERAGKKIAECIDSTVYAALQNEDGKYYKMPWTGGVNGILYNNEIMESTLGKDWKENYPCRTTDELLDLCAALKKAGVASFVHSAETNYYSFFYEGWFAQYNGTEGMKKYFNARYTDFLGDEVVGVEFARNQGVLESAKVMESIFANGYSHEKSNSIDWEVTQTMFMSGEAAMFSNGDWNNLEMSKQFPDKDIRFMKLPIISALATKLGITDEQLALVVDYVDGVGEKPSVSSSSHAEQEIIDVVTDARSWVASYVDAHNVFVPAYSVNADVAKEFLKFMVSDEGQHIFSESTKGLTMCYGYNLEKDAIYNGLSEFAKTRWEIAENAKFYITSRAEAYAKAGVSPFRARSMGPVENLLSRKDDRYTAQMIYEEDYNYFKKNWETIQSKLR